MHKKHLIFAATLAVGLAGCGASMPATHTAAWFMSHPKTLHKDALWCGKHKDQQDTPLCQAVYNAQANIAFYGKPNQPIPPAASGGGTAAVTKFLNGGG
jgi:hypothetical protein